MKSLKIRPIAVTGIMSALGFVLMCFEFPLPFLIPSFIQFDFSELPALITSFAFGPVYGVLVCLVKNILHLPMTKTTGVGEFANFLLGAFFCFASGVLYKRNKTFKGAIIACIIGAFVMALVSLPVNYYVTYPVYYKIFAPEPTVLSAYKALLSSVKTIPQALLIFNMPFTLAKGIIDSLICFAIYKKISPLLKTGKK